MKIKKVMSTLMACICMTSLMAWSSPAAVVTTAAEKMYTSKGFEVEENAGLTTIKGMLIVNKSYSVPSNYSPEGLDYIDASYSTTGKKDQQMNKTAYEAFKKMAKAAEDSKKVPMALKVTSGYRDISTQAALYKSYSDRDGAVAADTFSARAQHSEHHTGLAIDICSAESSLYTEGSDYMKMANWLAENCCKYGFIVRYPKGKDSITGYKYEPWHLRYIGDTKLCEEITKAGTVEEYFGISSKYDYADTFSNAEEALKKKAQSGQENEVTAELESPEQMIVDSFSTSQKESYMILANKYMTETELQAMEWNLVLSQFAVPYRESIQDVWNHTSFKDMREKGLVVSDNPYIDTIKENLNALSFKDLASAVDIGIVGTDDKSVITRMNEIADVMMEDNVVSYSMVYKGDSIAYVSDLFSTHTSALFVKDKVAVTGDASNKTEMWDALQALQDGYLVESKTKEELATDVTSGSAVFDIKMPVWVNTDSTTMYNAIYVANAIRIGGYGSFGNFIDSVKNSQLYMDRWGNLCAYLKIDGEYRYVIVYPAYSNPIFTSTEIADDDFAGYVYEDFGDTNNTGFWKKIGSLNGYTSNGGETISRGINNLITDGRNKDWGNVTAFAINPTKVAKTYKQIKDNNLVNKIDAKDKNKFLGLDVQQSQLQTLAQTSSGKIFGTSYSRERDGYSQKRDLIPLMEVDTTTNMLFNKAILSAYTRDSGNAVKGKESKIGDISSYYMNNWYSCLNDNTTTYSKFSLTSQYNKNNKEALFSNSIVFDKYYTNMLLVGATNQGTTDGKKDPNGICISANGNKYIVQESTATIAVSSWDYKSGNGAFEPKSLESGNSPFIFKSVTDGLKIVDPTSTAKNVMTLYPWMQMHTYRKGLYSDTPSLQPTKTKGNILDLNSYFEDRYVSQSWSIENVIATKYDEYRSGSWGGTDSQIPIEIMWNAMYSDSDKFKTYVVFNYTSEVLPQNSVLYGMGHRLTKANQGTVWYQANYVDSNLKGDKAVGHIYTSIPLFDATLDTGVSWAIWSKKDDQKFVDSVQSGARKRPMPTESSAGTIAEYKQGMFFEPVKIAGDDTATALRFMLNDQRVSDVLENYPLEDITLLSFVWRNYYTPQTPFRTKLNTIIHNDTGSKPYNLKADSSVTFDIGEDSYLAEDTVLTPGNIIASDPSKVNNTLVWTNACSNEQENKLSLGYIGGIAGIGETDSIGVSHTTVNTICYNFGLMLLAVNKNTQGDNLTNLIAGYDAASEFNTDDIMNNIAYFFEHPVLAISNIFMGFVQLVHNNVAVGNVGNIFDISWVIDLAIAKGVMRWYMAMSAMICSVVLVIRGLGFMFNRKQKLKDILAEWLSAICLSTVPVIILYSLSDGLKLLSTNMTKSVAGNLVAVEIEKEVTSSENLNLDFETVYSAYKEQFAGIEDSYSKLAMKVPYKWNATLNTMEYKEVTIRELYDNIEYSNVLASANLEASALETAAGADGDIEEMYVNQSPAVNHLYYTYAEFIPVNYEKYSENIFYYFYDYIKYQYLAYWSAQTDGNSAAFSAAAKNFSLPDVDKDEKWSTYVGRMWDAERYMLLKSYNGMYIMMHDDDYTYAKLYDDKGNSVYRGAYPTDMFGLSYMFNMTDLSKNQTGYTGAPGSAYFLALQVGSDNQLLNWKNAVQYDFDNGAGTYSSLVTTMRESGRRHRTDFVHDFYPLAYLMDNPAWQLIKRNNVAITRTPSSGKFIDYQFTPTYLESTFNEKYPPEIHLNLVSLEGDVETVTNNTESFAKNELLKFQNIHSSRLPWRSYASKSLLYRHTFDGNSYDTKTTDFEVLLMKCNEDAFHKVRDLTEYLQGDIRDSSLIFAAALIATMEFNETFSGSFLAKDKLEPRSFTADSMDLDKFMRVTYARDMDEIVKNGNVMYMIYEQEGGIITAVIVALTEIMIAITMLARVGVLILLLLGCAYVCFCYAFHKHKLQQAMLVGLLTQLLQIVASQFILMLVVTQSMTWISETNTTITRLLVAILSLVCCFALTRWSLYMLFALIKDFKNFGGAIIQGSVNTTMSRMKSAFSDIRNNNQLKNISANIHNASVGERALAGSGVGGATLARRMRNSGKITRATDQIEESSQELEQQMRDFSRDTGSRRRSARNLARSTDNNSATRSTVRRGTGTGVGNQTDNSKRIKELESDILNLSKDYNDARKRQFDAEKARDATANRQVELREKLKGTTDSAARAKIEDEIKQNKILFEKQSDGVRHYQQKADTAGRALKNKRNMLDNLNNKK